MSALAHIRKQVLGLSQVDLAKLAGVTQATVSRWERGELSPDLDALTTIRAAAKAKTPEWDDRLFFEEPAAEPAGSLA